MALRALLRLRVRGCAHACTGVYASRAGARGAGLRVVGSSSGYALRVRLSGRYSGRAAVVHPALLRPGRAPNNSFKPTPCRGVSHVLYATLAHVRRPATGRLNSGVRTHKK